MNRIPKASDFQIDSRLVLPGSLFFAVKGQTVDGHSFLEEVKRKGAVGAVIDEGYRGPVQEGGGFTLIRVPSVLEALRELVKESLKEKRPKVIGITGSVGKTVTKEFLASLLSVRFRVGKTEKSYNTKWTVPLALLNRTGEEEVFVVEMGMSEPGDLCAMVEMVPPDFALLTKVALAHAEFFPGGLSEIAKGKGQIFSHERTKWAICQHAALQFPEVKEQIQGKTLSYSLEEKGADFFLSEEGRVKEKGEEVATLFFPFQATHFRENVLGAIAVARLLGLSWEEIQSGLDRLKLPEKRFNVAEKGGVIFIDDTYNANPASMKAALLSLPTPKERGRKIAILGSMRELGSFSEEAHREVGRFAAEKLDHLFLLGEETKAMKQAWVKSESVEWFSEKEALIERVGRYLRAHDVLLCKASRSLQMETVLEKIMEYAPFSS